jgi:hypothetical protein
MRWIAVSLFYTFYGEADVTTDEIRSVMAAAVGGTVGADGTIFRDGMNVTAFRVEPEDAHSTTGHFGFQHRVTAVFNFSNRASAETGDHNVALMVEAVLAFFDVYPGRGVLLFNGEEVVLQRLGDGVEFNSEWEDWSEVNEVAPLVARHSLHKLAQPLM